MRYDFLFCSFTFTPSLAVGVGVLYFQFQFQLINPFQDVVLCICMYVFPIQCIVYIHTGMPQTELGSLWH